MERTGIAELPLHYGKAPPWLINRMRKLAGQIVAIVIDECGQDELLRRLSDPHWFQALGCVLGYDWHSSGLTTVVTAVLKQAVNPEEHRLAVAGGKGRFSRRTPKEIERFGEVFGFSEDQLHSLQYASRMSAKVDNAAIQAGCPLYHHTFFTTEDGRWAVIQQGMDTRDRTARRYHWISDHVKSFVDEPHEAIVSEVFKNQVLNMTARESEEPRRISTDLVKDDPQRVERDFKSLRPAKQRALSEWLPGVEGKNRSVRILTLPKRINWAALKQAYEFQPRNYEELLSTKGIGPATVRGLALVSEVIYGKSPSWKDPAKFSFAFGGKDGVPYPVNRRAMDEAHQMLKSAVDEAKIEKREKLKAFKRLSDFVVK
ncbi:MAG: DUF763 domain-containing protein [Candidatus Hadarchaeota archaeon]|nr:DUF763 domain-containing protein [Candidatus Hadarchaeota archaeon]